MEKFHTHDPPFFPFYNHSKTASCYNFDHTKPQETRLCVYFVYLAIFTQFGLFVNVFFSFLLFFLLFERSFSFFYEHFLHFLFKPKIYVLCCNTRFPAELTKEGFCVCCACLVQGWRLENQERTQENSTQERDLKELH